KNRLPRAFTGERLRIQVSRENIQRTPAATALITGLALAVFFGDAHHIETHQWLKIPRGLAFGRHDQDVLRFINVTGLDLLDAGIVGARRLVCLLEKSNLLRDLEFRRINRNRIKSGLIQWSWNLNRAACR